MDLHSLTYFKKAAELQHISRAAEELHVAQPSLSRTIAALEDDLGVQLFDRVGKNISLNKYGEIVLRRTNRILQEIADMEAELADTKGASNRSVSITLYAASKILPELIMAFKHEYPSIILRITQDDLDVGIQKDSDLSIFSSIQPTSGNNEVTLLEEDLLLALPDTNPHALAKSVDLRDMAGEEFICLQSGKSLRTITDMYCKIAGFTPNVILESDSPETVRELIRAGIGISFIPHITWKGMETKNIALLPVSYPKCKRYINLSWRQSSYLSPAALLFRDYVISYFRNLTSE